MLLILNHVTGLLLSFYIVKFLIYKLETAILYEEKDLISSTTCSFSCPWLWHIYKLHCNPSWPLLLLSHGLMYPVPCSVVIGVFISLYWQSAAFQKQIHKTNTNVLQYRIPWDDKFWITCCRQTWNELQIKTTNYSGPHWISQSFTTCMFVIYHWLVRQCSEADSSSTIYDSAEVWSVINWSNSGSDTCYTSAH